VLDIGSPKLPTLIIARRTACELYATDIRDYFMSPTTYFLTRAGLGHRLGRDVHLQVQDARRLSYEDGSFDRVFSISVLEHIPDDGDSQAMREIGRVLRPGGVMALTVPFCAREPQEEYVDGDVYERKASGHSVFYQRRYDLAGLHRRLVEPSGLHVVETTYFGEPRVNFERYWNRIPMHWKLPFLWAQPFIGELLFKTLRMDQLDAACGVALKLEKPLDATGEIGPGPTGEQRRMRAR